MPGKKHPFLRTAFAKALQSHMQTRRGDIGKRPPMWEEWTEGIYPNYRGLAEETRRADSVKLHSHISALISSQAFAFNLFLPFREGKRGRLSERIGEMVGARLTIDKVRFEFVPPGELLCELDGAYPAAEPATAVDVVLWGWLENGRRAAVLVEVKLSERTFSDCSGYISKHNERQDVCENARFFFNVRPSTANDPDRNACYIRRPKGKQRDWRYWEIFSRSYGSVRDAFPGAELGGRCPFARDLYQPMRNLAIARGLEQEDMVEKAWFALCLHDRNPDIPKHWEEWTSLLPDPSMAPCLPASEIVSVGEAEGLNGWAEYMRERYQL